MLSQVFYVISSPTHQLQITLIDIQSYFDFCIYDIKSVMFKCKIATRYVMLHKGFLHIMFMLHKGAGA